jgi:hypothetical protein
MDAPKFSSHSNYLAFFLFGSVPDRYPLGRISLSDF